MTSCASRVALLLLFGSVQPACGGTPRSTGTEDAAEEPRETRKATGEARLPLFTGTHGLGFEWSAFFPSGACAPSDNDPGFWFVGNRAYADRIDELFPDPGIRPTLYLDVTFRGRVSPPGRYGHLDRWPRQIEMVEFISARISERCESHTGGSLRVEILDQIYFDRGSSAVAAEYAPILEHIAATLTAHPAIETLVVTGWADSEEAETLALERATAVVKHLQEMKVKTQLRAQSAGKAPADLPADRARRVEFSLIPAEIEAN